MGNRSEVDIPSTEQLLEQAVFGSKPLFIQKDPEQSKLSKRRKRLADNDPEPEKSTPVAAWQDEDEPDEKTLIDQVSNSTVSWAALPSGAKSSKLDSDDEELSTHTASYIASTKRGLRLPKSLLVAKSCRYLNHQHPQEISITALQFHPKQQLALVAGADRRLNLFNVDGHTNSNASSVYFENFPISDAKFVLSRNSVMVTSFVRNFYMYNLETCQVVPFSGLPGVYTKVVEHFSVSKSGKYIAIYGKEGLVYLVHSRNLQLAAKLQLNNIVTTLSFSEDEVYLNCGDNKGFVYIYDLRNLPRCMRKFNDEGAIRTTSIAVSPDMSMLGVGSSSGILNLYDYKHITSTSEESTYKPVKVFKNLLTPVEDIIFNHTNEFCVYSSPNVTTAYKMIHLSSLTVFSNMPERNKNLGKVERIDVSPNSKFFAAASKNGKVYLYSLPHYDAY